MTAPLSSDALTELERLAAEATPGPFEVCPDGHIRDDGGDVMCQFYDSDEDGGDNVKLYYDRPDENAAYLTALLNAAPELLRVCRAAADWRAAKLAERENNVSLHKLVALWGATERAEKALMEALGHE